MDPALIAGNSGWAGAGLLGAVLAWLLLKHLPAKDAQFATLIENQQKHVGAIAVAHAQEVREAVAAFTIEAREQRADCRSLWSDVLARHAQFEGVVHHDLEAIDATLHRVAERKP